MNIRHIPLLLLLLTAPLLRAIPFDGTAVGEWRSHLSYHNLTQAVETPREVFFIANGTLFSYDKGWGEMKGYDKVTGLSDYQIAQLAYAPNDMTLVVAYSNGNIDLMRGEGVYNIPFLKEDIQINNKTVASIYVDNSTAYISFGKGVLALDLDKRVIKDFYNINRPCYATHTSADSIFVATSTGVIKNDLRNNLLDLSQWVEHPLTLDHFEPEQATVKMIAELAGERVYWITRTASDSPFASGVYREDSLGVVSSVMASNTLRRVYCENERLYAIDPTGITCYTSFDEEPARWEAERVEWVTSRNPSDSIYYAALGTLGFNYYRQTAEGWYPKLMKPITLNSPKYNYCWSTEMAHGQLYQVGGGRWTAPLQRPGSLSILTQMGGWINAENDSIQKWTRKQIKDFTSVAVDPEDRKHYWATTNSCGLIEFDNYRFKRIYDKTNSSLIPAYGSTYFLGGVAYDEDMNLFMTNGSVDTVIHVRDNLGKWHPIYYNALSNKGSIFDIFIDSNGDKWVNMPRQNPGLFLFNERGTFDDTKDDLSYFFTTFFDQDDKNINATGFFCVAEDLDGKIWVGTDKGPIYFPRPELLLEQKDAVRCRRVKIPYNDGTNSAFYLLDGQRINAIAIDGANRKWIGTESTGLYLFSADGREELLHFTPDNSPLPTNYITSLSIDPEVGTVYIGTDYGLISFRGEAIEGKEDLSNVYAFPNPVRPDYGGVITVTGLMDMTEVRITDIGGNLIIKGTSMGGQFVWDGSLPNGMRAKTGIYLVFGHAEGALDSSETVVTKIMVVN